VRIIIFCTIALLVSFGAFAQEREGHEQKPQRQVTVPPIHAPADAITLSVIANTPPDKKDLTHQIVFPKSMTRDEAIDACAKELAEFLKHKFPDSVELKARVATCVVPEVMDDKS
jgi:hypothetical protein